MTGALSNWRVWYLGLVWLLMESALFGIIFWYATSSFMPKPGVRFESCMNRTVETVRGSATLLVW